MQMELSMLVRMGGSCEPIAEEKNSKYFSSRKAIVTFNGKSTVVTLRRYYQNGLEAVVTKGFIPHFSCSHLFTIKRWNKHAKYDCNVLERVYRKACRYLHEEALKYIHKQGFTKEEKDEIHDLMQVQYHFSLLRTLDLSVYAYFPIAMAVFFHQLCPTYCTLPHFIVFCLWVMICFIVVSIADKERDKIFLYSKEK